jgi:hypothetical protein
MDGFFHLPVEAPTPPVKPSVRIRRVADRLLALAIADDAGPGPSADLLQAMTALDDVAIDVEALEEARGEAAFLRMRTTLRGRLSRLLRTLLRAV